MSRRRALREFHNGGKDPQATAESTLKSEGLRWMREDESNGRSAGIPQGRSREGNHPKILPRQVVVVQDQAI